MFRPLAAAIALAALPLGAQVPAVPGWPSGRAKVRFEIVVPPPYNRRYSLFYDYGHRWVDMRRYRRLSQLPKALPSHRVFPIVPLPVDECNQRTPQPKGCVQVSGF
ncbi:MAG: hypothetical protein ACREOG_07480 [Gemmatimonadaceae bacterium]